MIKEQGISIGKNNYPVSAVENDSFTQYIEAQLLENYKSYDHFTEACIFMVGIGYMIPFIISNEFYLLHRLRNMTYCVNYRFVFTVFPL